MPPTRTNRIRPAGTLKAAQCALVGAVGGLERAADLSRVQKSQIFRYTDDHEPGAHMPVDVVRDLERASGRSDVTRFLAAEAGKLLVSPADLSGGESLPAAMARFSSECADVFTAAANAMADGRVSGAEAGAILAEVDEALSRGVALRMFLSQLRDGPETGGAA